MRLLVCGGRNFNDAQTFEEWMAAHRDQIHVIITGGAPGADKMAELWARQRGIPCEVYAADWSKGKIAGPMRNQRMIDEGKPDAVMAFEGGRGTADMCRRAEYHGIPVIKAYSRWFQ